MEWVEGRGYIWMEFPWLYMDGVSYGEGDG